jgi:hypothetical protein
MKAIYAIDSPSSRREETADLRSRILATVDGFIAWLDRFGETSYDHQSYYAGPIGGRAKALYYAHPRIGLPAVAPMVVSEAFLPGLRRLFWQKQRFPIADAHYAMGFAMLAQLTGDTTHYDRAAHFLRVLMATRSPGYAHYCWGYPFDWVTRTGVMPAGLPLITTLPYVYEAFEAVHALDGDPAWLEVMLSAAEHAASDIKDKPVGPDAASAGYNPLDTEAGVVNASAYRAFMLFRAARQFGRDDFRAIAQRNLNFVLRSQQPDGSWFYAMDGVRDFVDHFHTCFVLKALGKIHDTERHDGCREAIRTGVDYYVRNLFDEAGLPRPFARAPRLTVYRHELYDYAECINLGALLRGRFSGLEERLDTTVGDLLLRWRKPDGSFRARRLMFGWDNVPMHRWAQSQMFRALCFLLRTGGARPEGLR